MGSKTLVITKRAKLELNLGSILIRDSDGTKTIPIEMIGVLLIEMQGVTITGVLLSELIRQKVKVIFCDEKHNPQFECMPYYGTSDTSSKVREQIRWKSKTKDEVWKKIVELKILHQASVLKVFDKIDAYNMLLSYKDNVRSGDVTNREGHSAKVYFNALFGNDFSRRDDNEINAKLNYGYSLLLSMCSREITALGYITQLGIHHDNCGNAFNLACDLMEIFRPIVDDIILKLYLNEELTSAMKKNLVSSIMETRISMAKMYKLDYALGVFVQSVINALESDNVLLIKDFDYEY